MKVPLDMMTQAQFEQRTCPHPVEKPQLLVKTADLYNVKLADRREAGLHLARSAWQHEVVSRSGEITGFEQQPVMARHTCGGVEQARTVVNRTGDTVVYKECTGCKLEEHAREGHPVVRCILTVRRDKLPINLITVPKVPRKHKLQRWMSARYHTRIQKKWNKLAIGAVEHKPEQEVVKFSMSPAQLRAVLALHRGA